MTRAMAGNNFYSIGNRQAFPHLEMWWLIRQMRAGKYGYWVQAQVCACPSIFSSTHEQQFTSSKSNSTFTDMLQKQHSFLEEEKEILNRLFVKQTFAKGG